MQRHDYHQESSEQADTYAAIILAAFGSATYELTLSSGMLRASPNLNTLVGYPAEQVRSFADYWARTHPDDRAELEAKLAGIRAGELWLFQGETRLLLPTGETRWVLYMGEVAPDGAGVPALVRGVVIDITSSRCAEQALRASEARHAFLLRLNDLLLPLSDPAEVQSVAARALGEYVGASRVGYAEQQNDAERIVVTRNYTAGVPDMLGSYRYADFGVKLLNDLLTAHTIVRADIASDATLSEAEQAAHLALQMGATVNVPLVRAGRLVAVFFVHYREAHAWTPSELALIEAVAARTWDAVERTRAETALRASQERLQLATEAGNIGTFVWHPPKDHGGPDQRMLALFGLPADGSITLSAILTRLLHPDDRARYAAAIERALDPDGDGGLREDVRIVDPDGSIRWLAVTARTVFADGPPRRALRMAGMASDITAQRRREAHLAFLNQLQDECARLTSVDEIMQAVGVRVGAYLDIANCFFVEIDTTRDEANVSHIWRNLDAPEIVGVYQLSEFVTPAFTATARAGETLVIRDVMHDARTKAEQCATLGMLAFVSVPFHQGDEWRYLFTVNSTVARDWRDDEVELIGEVTRHIFPRLERARAEAALRESEARYRTLFESMDEGFCIIEVIFDQAQQPIDYRFVQANPAFERMTGIVPIPGRTARELAPQLEGFWLEIYGHVVLTGEAVRFEHGSETMGHWFDVYAARIGATSSRQVLLVFNNISARKAAEDQVRLALSDAHIARQAAENVSRRIARLQTVTADLAGALSQAAVVAVITEHGLAMTGAAAGIIALLDADGLQLEVIGWIGHGSELQAQVGVLPLSTPAPITEAVHRRTPIWLASRDEAEARFPSFGAVMARFGDHALAVLPLLVGERVLGTISFSYRMPNVFSVEDRGFLRALSQQCAQALERARLYEEVLLNQAQLHQLSQRLIETQEQERRHLARELHDEVGQALTGLRMSLELAGRALPEEQAMRLSAAHRATQELIGQVRALSLELRPAMLDDRGLLPAIIWQLRRYREQTGIEVTLRHQGLEARLPPAVETVAYRVVQEALTNVARHAGVDAATVSLLVSPGQLLIQVQDCGCGFSFEQAMTSGQSSGLAGMRERVALLGGTLSIESAPAMGVTVTVDLPLTKDTEL
jgi:PAS domain S-box-containing protein